MEPFFAFFCCCFFPQKRFVNYETSPDFLSAWGGVDDDRILFFGWTVPLIRHPYRLLGIKISPSKDSVVQHITSCHTQTPSKSVFLIGLGGVGAGGNGHVLFPFSFFPSPHTLLSRNWVSRREWVRESEQRGGSSVFVLLPMWWQRRMWRMCILTSSVTLIMFTVFPWKDTVECPFLAVPSIRLNMDKYQVFVRFCVSVLGKGDALSVNHWNTVESNWS